MSKKKSLLPVVIVIALSSLVAGVLYKCPFEIPVSLGWTSGHFVRDQEKIGCFRINLYDDDGHPLKGKPGW